MDGLRAALALWRGELLPEDGYAEWAGEPRARLAELRAGLVHRLADALIVAGVAGEAVALLEPLVAERRLDEPLHRSLMTALAATGPRWDALAVYGRLRAELLTEPAAEPDRKSRVLYRPLLAGAAAASVQHTLPAAVTSLVGAAGWLTWTRR